MLELDKARRSALQQYTSNRRYVADNRKFNKHAEVAVREKYVYPEEGIRNTFGDWVRLHSPQGHQ